MTYLVWIPKNSPTVVFSDDFTAQYHWELSQTLLFDSWNADADKVLSIDWATFADNSEIVIKRMPWQYNLTIQWVDSA